MNEPTIAHLKHYGVLQVIGDKARDFLQGQTTCDVNTLNTEHGLLGACCNNKGRVLAMFTAAATSDGIMLVMPADVIPLLTQHLTKYALLSRVALRNDTDAVVIFHVQQCQPDTTLSLQSISLEGETYLVGEQSKADEIAKSLSANMPVITEAVWHAQRIQQKHPQLTATSFNLFTPHQLTLPALGYVSFTKGCYTGQEIVSRMEYLGKGKYHLAVVPIANGEQVNIGESLETTTAKGVVVDKNNMHYLVSLKQ